MSTQICSFTWAEYFAVVYKNGGSYLDAICNKDYATMQAQSAAATGIALSDDDMAHYKLKFEATALQVSAVATLGPYAQAYASIEANSGCPKDSNQTALLALGSYTQQELHNIQMVLHSGIIRAALNPANTTRLQTTAQATVQISELNVFFNAAAAEAISRNP